MRMVADNCKCDDHSPSMCAVRKQWTVDFWCARLIDGRCSSASRPVRLPYLARLAEATVRASEAAGRQQSQLSRSERGRETEATRRSYVESTLTSTTHPLVGFHHRLGCEH